MAAVEIVVRVRLNQKSTTAEVSVVDGRGLVVEHLTWKCGQAHEDHRDLAARISREIRHQCGIVQLPLWS